MTSRSAIRSPQIAGPTQIEPPKIRGQIQGKTNTANKAGKLPEWNLADLYSGIDAPEVTRDLCQAGHRMRCV